MAGFISYHNEGLPPEGEELIISNYKIEILQVENNRIKKIKLTIT